MPVTSSEPSSAGSNALHTSGSSQRDRVAAAAHEVLAKHPPATTPVTDLLGAVYDAGLAWVHFPVGLGGLDAPPALQAVSDTILRAAGVPDPLFVNVIGYGMAAPTVLAHGQPELIRRILRPLFTGEELWCQLFSEPGAGSDLAGLATRAVRDGDDWVINGQKVWTSGAHQARWALLVARSNPDVAKHRGLTYFVVDVTDPGVEVRPLRQMTGDAEFNEVYLTDVRIPDAHRLGNEGDGWRVSMTTLMNERSALGGAFDHGRGGGSIGNALNLWKQRPDLHTPELRAKLTNLFVRSEGNRYGTQMRIAAQGDAPMGPEGSIGKLMGAELNQQIYDFCVELLGIEATLYASYDMRRVVEDDRRADTMWAFLRSKANTIEGGTSDVMRNIIGERVLGLPGDIRVDTDKAWKDVPRG
ncbi:acyl-CoA dehydrogenase family protein [Mycobacteroides abscessus]|uniref:acyl-CoA dehydrogenase family protein n=1 Tax=Mycobacteroides abscessus TaxID=36809 RepID=UPI000C2584F8|nr:acyl-CoA dehydrogenase family protein [Mycobacteroides abscessus]